MRRAVVTALLALSILPFFVGLGDNAIWDANEAFYVETPRQMLERGDYLNPSFNDRPRFNKPPLSYWVVAAFYQTFGVSVVSERVAIALGALVLVGTAFLIGRLAWSTEAGLFGALVLASSPRVVMFARRIFIDVYVAAFMGLTLLCFALAESQPGRRRAWLVLLYITVGLAFMTKGPIAVVLPAGVLVVYLALDHRLGDLQRLMLPAGALIVAALVVPWYAALYAEHGWVYIRTFFVDENLSRYTEPYGTMAAGRGLLFYVPVLLTDLFPWSVFLPAAFFVAARHVWTTPAGELRRRLPLLLLVWIAVIVGFFTLSRTKQDLYIFPAVTAIAALVGGLLGPVVAPGRETPSVVRWTTVVAGVLLALGGATVLFLFASAARVYAIDGAVLIGALAVVAGLVAAASATRRQVFAGLAGIAACAVALNWVFVLRVLPSFRQYQPVPALADAIRVHAGGDAVVGQYHVALPSLVYYAGRPTEEIVEPARLAELLAGGPAYVAMPETDYDALRARLPVTTCVLADEPSFNAKIGSVLARAAPPDVVLITNQCDAIAPP
jgi:4-amino-4-deoxy-L-arabinose transferase-like glycosyltransferase